MEDLPERALLVYPILSWPEESGDLPWISFEFSSDCAPFREHAAFLFSHMRGGGRSALAVGSARPTKTTHFALDWLPGADGGRVLREIGSEGERPPPGIEQGPLSPRVVVMTVDDEERFRTDDLGSAIAHFESHLSFDLLCKAVESFGYLHLHGAAVETSSGAVLIVGGEDRGKTSLAMALVALGASPVTDDNALLVPGEGRLARVPRLFRFDERTFGALSPLRKPSPVFTFHPDPRSLDSAYHFVDAFAEGGFVPGFSGPVTALVFPAFSPERAGARLFPLRWGEALRGLLSQTMTPMGEDLFPRWFDPIEGARCFRLEWGDLSEAARRLWETLEGRG